MNRIIVVGTSGSGKTTMARTLAQKLGVSHIELDALHWEPGWQEAPPELFRERVIQAISAERWVMDGNYSVVRDLTWARADTIIWLDFPKWLVMWRIIQRTLKRALTREPLWGKGNIEPLSRIFTKDSVIWWAWTTYERRKREYPVLFGKPEFAHLTIIHLRSPREAQGWLNSTGRQT
jgi:adenylate kinase family enzyme